VFFVLVFVILAIGFLPPGVNSASAADQGFYVSGKTGLVLLGAFKDINIDNLKGLDFSKVEFDTGIGVLGAVGYDFGLLRLEGEFGYSNNNLDRFKFDEESFKANGDVTDVHLLVNLFVDIPNPTPFVPYVGGGAGVSYTSVNGAGIDEVEFLDDNAVVFAYQVGAGIGYEITDSLVLELGYRYFATVDPNFTNEFGFDVDAEHSSHNVTVGLRITF